MLKLFFYFFLVSGPEQLTAVRTAQHHCANPGCVFCWRGPEASLQALQGELWPAAGLAAPGEGPWMEPWGGGAGGGVLAGLWCVLQGDGRRVRHAPVHSLQDGPWRGGGDDGHPPSRHSFPQAGGGGGGGGRLRSPCGSRGLQICSRGHWWVPCEDCATCRAEEELFQQEALHIHNPAGYLWWERQILGCVHWEPGLSARCAGPPPFPNVQEGPVPTCWVLLAGWWRVPLPAASRGHHHSIPPPSSR